MLDSSRGMKVDGGARCERSSAVFFHSCVSLASPIWEILVVPPGNGGRGDCRVREASTDVAARVYEAAGSKGRAAQYPWLPTRAHALANLKP
jgi:hypothetical protein